MCEVKKEVYKGLDYLVDYVNKYIAGCPVSWLRPELVSRTEKEGVYYIITCNISFPLCTNPILIKFKYNTLNNIIEEFWDTTDKSNTHLIHILPKTVVNIMTNDVLPDKYDYGLTYMGVKKEYIKKELERLLPYNAYPAIETAGYAISPKGNVIYKYTLKVEFKDTMILDTFIYYNLDNDYIMFKDNKNSYVNNSKYLELNGINIMTAILYKILD